MPTCIEDGCPLQVPRGRCAEHEGERRAGRTAQGLDVKSPTSRVTSSRPWREKTRPAILNRDARTCAYCQRPADTVDHVVPPHSGGGHAWNYRNLVAACRPCNYSKQGRDPEQAGMPWPPGFGLYADGTPHERSTSARGGAVRTGGTIRPDRSGLPGYDPDVDDP
jgi:5-methylcytosine-specific restriction endonuclease McrA